MKQKNKLLDIMVASMVKAIKGSALPTEPYKAWPMPIISSPIEHRRSRMFFYSSLLKRFLDWTRKLEEKHFTDREIALIFKYPSILARFIHCFEEKQALNLTKDELIEIGVKITKYVSYLHKDPFCFKTGRNLIWSRKDLKAHFRPSKLINLNKIKDSEMYRELLRQLDGKLYCYSELLYMGYHNIGHEIHGPYRLGKNKLLVKNYHNLKPEFWKFTKNFPYDSITIFEVYKDVKVTLDLHNRIQTSKPLIPHIIKFYLQIDGQIINRLSSIKKILNELDLVIKKGIDFNSKLNKKELNKKLAEISFYMLKPLAKVLKQNWHPPQYVYRRIRENKLTDIEEKQAKLLAKLPFTLKALKGRYDPRISHLIK